MRPHEVKLHHLLLQGLQNCHKNEFPLPGVQNSTQRDVFLRQLIDSIRRVRYISVIAKRRINPNRANGFSPLFDPLLGAIFKKSVGNFDEACWLVFLFVHFGRHRVSKYRYAGEFYSALNQRDPWTFNAVMNDIRGMRDWLDQNEHYLRRGINQGFGNHRKYTSLSGSNRNGTGDAFESYVRWVLANGDHANLFSIALQNSNNSPEKAFEWLYQSMSSVASFGRLAKFDYLTMMQKLGFATICPGRPYLDSSTKGPNKGARLMLETGQPLSIVELESRIRVVGFRYLNVGMQEMEDSLCNWGKNPLRYKHFNG